ncbi:peptidylprolyl isomerase [Pseudoalteromonas sp. KG3]|uniref:peptidylprolyl isomerase n=1 Tax=Pseudoalteromonas sp. KG3 TaxID=2951137 RepID=UPI0026595E8B|nr:peptidylprolyl isomerase [Pseudoalteromonas sp. KG3]WKD25513.1 peptidylprolyl isomerase [Pseudoalteromonas sp. KG3]
MSLLNTPDVLVNKVKIPTQLIDAEIQYHPAATRREAMIQATEALIIAELFKQRASELNIIEANDENEEYIARLIDLEVAIPKASNEECRRYFSANQQKFHSSPIVEVNHILIASDPKDLEQREESKEQAKQVLLQLAENPSQFSQFVKSLSACPSKEQGGNLGQISSGQTVPEFERAIFAAKQGLINYPVETRYGHHIVKIARKIEGEALPYEYVQQKITDYLNEKVRHKAIAQYIQLLADEACIKGFTFKANESPLIQ